ncbi:alpha/beta fold hydrolase [Inquilinus limosus]|uniref:alpha/beta fold hydrolase n=1 Tax=Inquilinus limosus TaxID=171674 RepID=UPI000412B088|nr:alpha/beta hydrolase [Inquilinus limosus]
MVRGLGRTLLRAIAAITIGFATTAAQAAEVWQTLPEPPPMPKPAESGMAPVNDIQMYYAVFGTGRPVLLLHGGLSSSDYWGGLVPALTAQGFRVIVADSRGHGRSTRSAQPYSYDLMASDVLALLDHLKIQKADLVGWSDGGIIGLDIAIHHPERLNRLYAYGANSDLSGLKPDFDKNPIFAAFIERAGAEYRKLSKTPDQYDAFLQQISQMWATQPNFTVDQLRGIKVRTAIADGEHDEGIRREHTEYLARTIPGAELHILPNLSHFGMLQDPKAFNQSVLDFLTAP